MVKTVIKIDGMMCQMCEKHVNEAVESSFSVKSVKANKDLKQAEIVSENELDKAKLAAVITETGYTPGEITVESAKKKGFLGLFS